MMTSDSRSFRRLVVGALLSLLFLALSPAYGQAEERKLVGTVSMEEMNVALIASGSWGDGKLHFKGKTYPFKISGLGLGGLGISSVSAYGYVYDLKSVEDFAGVYGEASAGAVAGTVSTGSLWLQNEKGVILKLDAEREGLALALGAGGMIVQMGE